MKIIAHTQLKCANNQIENISLKNGVNIMNIHSDCQFFLHGVSEYPGLKINDYIKNDIGIFIIFSVMLPDVYTFVKGINYRKKNVVFCHNSVMSMLKGTTNSKVVFFDINLCKPYFLEKILTDKHILSVLSNSQCEMFTYLTTTEKKIIKMVAAGMSPAEFCLSTRRKYKTCMLHKRNAMKKLDVHSFVKFYFKCKIINRIF
nr:hypothetical protein [Salmonella enterica subsp. enterica]